MSTADSDVTQALHELLPAPQRTGDRITDLCQAAQESMRRRVANSRHGGAVIAALRTEGLSWRDIERRTGIPFATARRWAEPPPETDSGDAATAQGRPQ